MIQHYVLANWGLVCAYWVNYRKGSVPMLLSLAVLGVLLSIDVFWIGLFEFEDGATRDALKEALLYRPLSLLMGIIAGGGMAFVIQKPAYPASYRSWWYHTECLIGGALWLASTLFWQLLPQTWWNYTFLGLVLQLIIIVLSYLFIDHDTAWGTPAEARYARISEWHFFVLAILCLNLPFVIGQSVWPTTWPFYFSVTFFGLSVLWALFVSTCFRWAPPLSIPVNQ
jgi:hypothetical protein